LDDYFISTSMSQKQGLEEASLLTSLKDVGGIFLLLGGTRRDLELGQNFWAKFKETRCNHPPKKHRPKRREEDVTKLYGFALR